MGVLVNERIDRWLCFLTGGAVNTAFSYTVYLFLKIIMAYQWAYFIAYALGVVFAYWFNASWVFRVPISWRGLLSYPIVYVIQYLISALFLGALIEKWGVSVNLAPFYVIVALLPITYLMNRVVLTLTSKTKAVRVP
jgi:putative flippase GtrA